MRLHTHKCEACGQTFAHDRAYERKFRADAHMCPKCGAGPWFWVDGLVGKGGKVMSTAEIERALYATGRYTPDEIHAAIEGELNQ